MSDEVQRNRNGQFRPGTSGNAAGARLRQPKRLLTPADLDRIVLGIAAKEATVNVSGVPEQTNLYGAAVLQLASMKQGNRLAAKDFIEITNSSAFRAKRDADREEARLAEKERIRGY